MDLEELRKELDACDRELTGSYLRRLALTEEIGAAKIQSGKAVLDQERELVVLARAASRADAPDEKKSVRALYKHIMNISRSRQYEKIAACKKESFDFRRSPVRKTGCRVVYQGVEGAYGHQAALGFFGEEEELYHVASFEEVMEAVESGRADYGVVPAENSSTGIITAVYDLLSIHDVYIAAKYVVRVSHALLGLPQAETAGIRRVYSHPQGLLQCSGFLKKHPDWEQSALANTALSAQKILNDRDPSQAAICSPRAAKLYGLRVLEEQISDADNNATVFLILESKKEYEKDANEISITFTLSHEAGSLYQILGFIDNNSLNMTKIESRPIPGEKWKYRFFINFNGSLGDPAALGALTGIQAETEQFKILGNYIRVS